MLIRTTYLEIDDPAAIVPTVRPVAGVALIRALEPSPELNRFFYTAVGGDWHWRDRLSWTWAQWLELIGRPGYQTWYATVHGTPAGYFELDATAPTGVEVVTFGLIPAFIGRGLGGWLLEAALRRGFELGRRVWLHTCALDGPTALPNYLARGLRPFRTEDAEREVGEPPGPWPHANRPQRRGP